MVGLHWDWARSLVQNYLTLHHKAGPKTPQSLLDYRTRPIVYRSRSQHVFPHGNAARNMDPIYGYHLVRTSFQESTKMMLHVSFGCIKNCEVERRTLGLRHSSCKFKCMFTTPQKLKMGGYRKGFHYIEKCGPLWDHGDRMKI